MVVVILGGVVVGRWGDGEMQRQNLEDKTGSCVAKNISTLQDILYEQRSWFCNGIGAPENKITPERLRIGLICVSLPRILDRKKPNVKRRACPPPSADCKLQRNK